MSILILFQNSKIFSSRSFLFPKTKQSLKASFHIFKKPWLIWLSILDISIATLCNTIWYQPHTYLSISKWNKALLHLAVSSTDSILSTAYPIVFFLIKFLVRYTFSLSYLSFKRQKRKKVTQKISKKRG